MNNPTNNPYVTFEKISSVENTSFSNICFLLEKSFIPDERPEYSPKLLENNKFKLEAIFEKKQFIGFLGWWNFKDFIFIEHLALDKNFQGKGLGKIILNMFISRVKNITIIAECELPHTPTATNRLKFFEQLGFIVNKYQYLQPAYSKEKRPVPMLFISYPFEINKSEYEIFKELIYQEVYKIDNIDSRVI